jgi:hypothetical protein
MSALYRCLLRLYPADYFREYAAEMTSVFCSAQDAVRHGSFSARTRFYAREIWGVVRGSLREHFRSRAWNSSGRFEMRTEFRFPRSTILLMLLILVGVVLAIGKGMSVQLEYAADANALPPWSMLPGLYLMPFVLMCVFGVAGYAILVALRQSGSHRLSSVRTWPERR